VVPPIVPLVELILKPVGKAGEIVKTVEAGNAPTRTHDKSITVLVGKEYGVLG